MESVLLAGVSYMRRKYLKLLEDAVNLIEKIEQAISSGCSKNMGYTSKLKMQVLRNLEGIRELISQFSGKLKKKYFWISENVLKKINDIKMFMDVFNIGGVDNSLTNQN